MGRTTGRAMDGTIGRAGIGRSGDSGKRQRKAERNRPAERSGADGGRLALGRGSLRAVLRAGPAPYDW